MPKDDANSDKVFENVNIINKKKSKQDVQFIIGCLKKHFVFFNLSNN